MPSSARTQRDAERLREFLLLTLLGAGLILLGKLPGAPTAPFLNEHVSLTGLQPGLEDTLGSVVFVPLGALVVVIFRLTLGLRVLGPFRSILLALAFVSTGVLTGLLFLALSVGVLLVLRPLIRALRLPYYGRISVMLSLVALLIVCGGIVGREIGSPSLAGVAHFPVVVLCLVGEAVAREFRREGIRSGVTRVAMTAAAAVVVAGLASIGALRDLLLRHPELLLVEIALIALVSRYCAWHLLAPRQVPKRKRRPVRTHHESPVPS